jgi:hypothetical protein
MGLTTTVAKQNTALFLIYESRNSYMQLFHYILYFGSAETDAHFILKLTAQYHTSCCTAGVSEHLTFYNVLY